MSEVKSIPSESSVHLLTAAMFSADLVGHQRMNQ